MRKIDRIKFAALGLLKDPSITHGLKRALRKLVKEIILYENHVNGMRQWGKKRLKLFYPKIQIGGGSHILPGFLNIDIMPPANLLWDAREGLPLKDKSSDFIFSEHFLEHIDYPVSVKKFIKECFRVLRSGGILVIGVPDSELAVKAYVRRNKKFYKKAIKVWYSKRNCLDDFNIYIDLLNYHFRDQDDDDKYDPHLWAYDREKLNSLLKQAGFKKATEWKFDPKIANPKRKFGSIYIKGKK